MKNSKNATNNNDVKLLPAATTTAAKTEKPTENLTETIPAVLIPTADQRLKSLGDLKILGDNYNFVREKQDELKKFALSSDDTQEKIHLSNSKGFNFQTSNTEIIKDVVLVVQNYLGNKAKELETQILEFSI